MFIELKKFYSVLMGKGFTLEGVKESVEYNNTDKLFFEHLSKLFELSNITEKELHILINLSVLPAETKINDIKELLELDSNNDTLSLVEKGFLIRNKFNIFMHNVIQEVVRKKNDFRLETDCKLLINNLALFVETK